MQIWRRKAPFRFDARLIVGSAIVRSIDIHSVSLKALVLGSSIRAV